MELARTGEVRLKQTGILIQEVVGEFEAPESEFDIYDIAPAADNTVWVCCRRSTFVTRFDSSGTVMEEVEFGQLVNCLSVSSTTGHLWAGSGQRHCIYEINSSGKMYLRFRVDTLQKCLCVLDNENVAIGMLNEVSIYTAEGERIVSRKFKYVLNRISECPVTKNISVLVLDSRKAAASFIVMMNKDLIKLRFFTLNHSDNDIILASCVSYDGEGNLIVAAVWYRGCRHNVVILLDGHGHFLRTLTNEKSNDDCKDPVNSVGKNGVLWTVFHDSYRSPQKLKLLKYISPRFIKEQNLQNNEYSTHL